LVLIIWTYQDARSKIIKAEKAFTKWLSGMFPTSVEWLAEVHSNTSGYFAGHVG